MGDILVPSRYFSSAAEASRIVKATKGTVYGFFGYNGNAAARFIQLFDSATLPADGAIPAFTFTIAAGGTLQPTMPGVGIFFQNGIVICNSSTGGTKTIGAADSLFQVLYN